MLIFSTPFSPKNETGFLAATDNSGSHLATRLNALTEHSHPVRRQFRSRAGAEGFDSHLFFVSGFSIAARPQRPVLRVNHSPQPATLAPPQAGPIARVHDGVLAGVALVLVADM